VKLSAAEKASLFELSFSTGRPDGATPRLVQLGLAEQGRARFGNYVRITAKGRALANTFTREEQLAFLGSGQESGRGQRAASGVLAAVKGEQLSSSSAATAPRDPPSPRSAVPPTTSSPRSKPAPRQQREPLASTNPAGSAAGCRETPQAAAIDAAPSISSTPPRPTSHQRAASAFSARSVTPSGGEAPNALRVVNGARCIYYPLGFQGLKDGTFERVFTRNKLFRSYAVGASTADDQVL
jgi:hypothetical protein